MSLGAHTVAKLIGCNISDLKLALSTRKMKVGKDNIVQKLTLSQVHCPEVYTLPEGNVMTNYLMSVLVGN